MDIERQELMDRILEALAEPAAPRAAPGPLDVIFTQYLRPHGRTRTVWVPVTPEVKAHADALTADGYVFECEELTTGHVSLTVEHPKERDDGPLAHQLVPNGLQVPVAVVTLIRDAHRRMTEGL